MIQQLVPGQTTAQAFNKGLVESLKPALEQQYQRQLVQNGLQQFKQVANQPNTSPSDLAASLIQATAGIPGAERYIGQLLPLLLQQRQSQASQNVNIAPGQQNAMPAQRGMQAQVPTRQQLPGFQANPQEPQQNQFFPSAQSANNPPGNLPQDATTGIVEPILNEAQLRQEGNRIAQEYSAQGIPTNAQQGYDLAKQSNESRKLNNEAIEKARQQRTESQQLYGEKGAESLLKVMPDATPEMQSIFRKEAEKEAAQGKSEADIGRFLDKKAAEFKNRIASVKNSMPAPRSGNKIGRLLLGNDKSVEQATKDLRAHLKPLLDLGLYDTSRKLMADLGYYPEETERTLFKDLSDQDKQIINSIPKVPELSEKRKALVRPGLRSAYLGEEPLSEQTQNNLSTGLSDVFAKNRDVNLILLRKAFEDKGYDWRSFKDTINDLLENGTIKLSEDQRNQLQTLDSPPLNNLDKILHGIGLIGR